MNCKRIRSKLDLLAGDDLAGRDAAEVEAHLRQCLSCYREYVELRDLLQQVRSAARPAAFARSDDAAEAFVGDVMRQLHGPPPQLPRLLPRVALVSGWAAALVLGLTAGWFHWQGNRADRRSAPGNIIEHDGGPDTTIDQRIDRELGNQLDELRGVKPATLPLGGGDARRPTRRPKNF